MRRRWGPIVTGVALALTFAILVGLGTVEPPGQDEDTPAAQGSTGPPDWMRKLRPGEKPPQFVLFSFDGAGSHGHWRRILPIAEKVDARVTGFLSGIYLLPDSRRGEYIGPGHQPGRAAISFGGSQQEVDTRIADLNDAVERGHEIGTHYNGHFCTGNEPSGRHWSTAQWNAELDQFFDFVRDAVTHGLLVDESMIEGSRIPCLEGDFDKLAPALATHGLAYDSSLTSAGIAWPYLRSTDGAGIWEFAVPVVRVPALDGKKVIMADYNLWYALNGAREDPSRDKEFTEVTLDTYRAAYQAALNTNRAPLTVGTHFNDWSGGAFSAATEQFMREVCVRTQTVCTTYTQVIKWMKLQDPEVLDTYRTMPHAQLT
ncbi:polysaccharide deacetylase [Actinophytocola sp.]|uniref:polysaccharide deacetylase n=1 Tax=Actinophytocola sp. TaxID=1872138 RepID=UPI003D6C41A4